MTTEDSEEPDRPTEAIYTAARQECAKILPSEWPEDDWVRLTEDWTLNIYLSDDGQPAAVIYFVIDELADTGNCWAVPLENLDAIQAPAPAAP